MTKTMASITLPMHTLVTYKLSANQWLTLWLLHSKDWHTFEKYATAHGGLCSPIEMQKLLDKGYLIRFEVNKEIPLSAENLQVTEKFTDLLYGTRDGETVDSNSLLVDDDNAFNEFFHAYPAYIMVQGQRVSGRSADIDEMELLYSKIVKGKREVHEEIMDLLAWGLEQGLVTMGIAKFLQSRQWLGLKQLRDSGGTGQNTFNSSDVI